MKAMILAAGLGTRLRPLTEKIPKPMVPVAGVPNIERLIVHLRQQGIEEFAINLHYCPEPLQAHLGNGRRLDVKIEYFVETEILGTSGGIANMIHHMGNETFFVFNGDALFMPTIQPLLNIHRESGALASMVVRKSDDAANPGNVGLNEQRQVKRLVHGGDESIADMYMFTGMHIMEPNIQSRLSKQGCIARQSYIPMLENHELLQGIVTDGVFRDLGTPEDYLDVNLRIANGDIAIPGFIPSENGSLIAPTAVVEPEATIENSIIGDHVHVQKGVRVIQSIVMDGAVVTNDMQRCIVLSNGAAMTASDNRMNGN